MTRVCHYLKKNAFSQSPSNVLIIDTEANIEHKADGKQFQTFRLGYAIHLMLKDGEWIETEYELHSIDELWSLLDRIAYDKKRLYVFAHNMAYDYTILKLDSYISSRKLEIKMRVIDTVFMIRAGNILFLSSTNFYRQSLAELGKIFGLSKMDSPDFEHCSDTELMPYCIRDTQVLAHVMKAHIGFIKENDLGCFKPTIAGQAFNTYRHRFMKHELLVHVYADILELEKQSYRGGRCEAFRLGKFDNITCLDINSMYPFVMKSCEFPTKLISSKIMTDAKVSDLMDAMKSGYFLLANCDLQMNKPLIACKRDKLLFPVGNVRQTITSPEIEYLLQHPDSGIIRHVNSLVLYEKAAIFSDYVDYFYTFRQTTSNQAYREMSKLLMNSLYGKLGQHCSTIPKLVTDEVKRMMYLSMMEEVNSFEIFTGLTTKYVKVGEQVYQICRQDGEFARDSIPIIASAVTSYARVLLFELMESAGLKNVFYCDTDSLFVNEQGLANLQAFISPTKLGMLKIEKEGSVDIRGAKDYTFNGVMKLKGVKRNAERLSDGRFRQFNFETKNSRYAKGTPDGIVILSPVIKSLTGTYTKGIVLGDHVEPFSFSEF